MYGILVVVILTALASGSVQGADFSSSLDQDSRTSACPDETVTYVCVVPDPSGGTRSIRWSGSILQGQCPANVISLSHELFIVNGFEMESCGDLTAQIVNQISSGSDAEFNSTLPVTATAALNGTTIVCSGPGAGVDQFVEIGSPATLTLVHCWELRKEHLYGDAGHSLGTKNAAYGVAGENSELGNIPLQPNDAYGSNVVRRHRELDNVPIEPYEQVSQNITYGIARRHTEADYIPIEPNDAYEAYNQRTDT